MLRTTTAILIAATLTLFGGCAEGPQSGTGASDGNKAAWMQTFAGIAAKPGVTTTDSGLMFEVLKNGNGPTPAITDTVVTHYHGTLLDGTVFDSSYERGEPATFPLNRVIKGWTEALSMMPTGSKWRLYVPPDLAYGKRGAGAKIGPDTPLIFEVELLNIR